MDEHKLDCLLIYNAEDEDPAFLPWILGNNIFDTTYLLITKGETMLFIPQWFTEEALNAFDKFPIKIVGTLEKAVMMPTIIPYLNELESIGYAGNAPYKEFVLLNDKKLINAESFVAAIYEKKDEVELKIMAEVNDLTRGFLDKLDITQFVGRTEKDLAKHIRQEFSDEDYFMGHLSIVSGPRLKKTTAGFPTDYVIEQNDPVCIDFGLNSQTYYSDITRCYFLGESSKNYDLAYKALQNFVSKTAERITENTRSKEVASFLKEEFQKAGLIGELVMADFGHGIGTGRHEYPEVGFDESVFDIGTVFTLEPEVRLPDGTLIRYEDVFYVYKNGKTNLCK